MTSHRASGIPVLTWNSGSWRTRVSYATHANTDVHYGASQRERHWRAGCPEKRHVQFGGGPLEKVHDLEPRWRPTLLHLQLLRTMPPPDGVCTLRLLRPEGLNQSPVARSTRQPAADVGGDSAHRRRAGCGRRWH